MILFAALARDLAVEADRQLGDARAARRRARSRRRKKFLEAIWRYYNLVDFAVTQCDARPASPSAWRSTRRTATRRMRPAPPRPLRPGRRRPAPPSPTR